MGMDEKILFVDDDPNILAAYRRQFHGQFEIETASSGFTALEYLSNHGKIAVVIADYRMPGMDGIQFLRRAKEMAPDSVRMMLTGYAELGQAIDAVNEGSIFRFLTKPCPPEILSKALQSALAQYRLIHAEKELLEKTLSNSVRLLIEVLSLANPIAYSQMLRLRKIVHTITTNMQETRLDEWMYKLAAMLSQIGCVALPRELLEKVAKGEALTDTEQNWYATHPLIGYKFLENIPRIGAIPLIIRDQQKNYCDFQKDSQSKTILRQAELGAQILKVALDYDVIIHQGENHMQVINTMAEYTRKYNPAVVQALGKEAILGDEFAAERIVVKNAILGMIANEDIYAKDGSIVVPKSQEFSLPVLERLQLMSRTVGIYEPFRVLLPEGLLNQNP
jgi:response regulator RpfG family c-di-GMP phosphodiesterase